MAWKHLENAKVVKCTRAIANRFNEMEPCPGDRNYRPRTAGVIATAIGDGRMRGASFASCFCRETGTEYRVNGKHTAAVLSAMNGDFPKNLTAVIERYEADTLSDMANLYATFDPRSSARSTSDINKSFAGSHPELSDVPQKIINVCVTGVAFANWELQYFARPAEVRAQLLLDNSHFAIWFYELCERNQQKHKHILRSPVAAASFLTFKKNAAASTEFWELVRDGSGKNHKSADRTLNKYLLQTAVNFGCGARSEKKQDDQRAMFVRCIHAWNAWRDGQTTDLKYFASAKTPALK